MILRPGDNQSTSLPPGVTSVEIQAKGTELVEEKMEIIEGKLILIVSIYQEENWRERFFQLLNRGTPTV